MRAEQGRCRALRVLPLHPRPIFPLADLDALIHCNSMSLHRGDPKPPQREDDALKMVGA